MAQHQRADAIAVDGGLDLGAAPRDDVDEADRFVVGATADVEDADLHAVDAARDVDRRELQAWSGGSRTRLTPPATCVFAVASATSRRRLRPGDRRSLGDGSGAGDLDVREARDGERTGDLRAGRAIRDRHGAGDLRAGEVIGDGDGAGELKVRTMTRGSPRPRTAPRWMIGHRDGAGDWHARELAGHRHGAGCSPDMPYAMSTAPETETPSTS